MTANVPLGPPAEGGWLERGVRALVNEAAKETEA